MSILYMDNFQFYGSNVAELIKGTAWVASGTGGALPVDPAGGGLRVLKVGKGTGDIDASPRMALPVPGNKIGVGVRCYLANMPQTNNHGAILTAWKTGANNHKYGLRVTASGELVFFRSSSAGAAIWNGDFGGIVTLATSAPLIMTSNTWVHVESVVDTATGDYEVRVEGVLVLSGTDATPAAGDIGMVAFVSAYDQTATGEPAFHIKDVVIWDDNGTQNNSFIGPVTVYYLPVNSDVSSGWARSSGATDYELLNEIVPNDAGYIEASDALPAASVMGLTNLPADVVSVRAVQMMSRNLKTDGGDGKLQMALMSGGVADLGDDEAVTTSVKYHWDISELDPNTATAWTPVTFNAADLRLNRTL